MLRKEEVRIADTNTDCTLAEGVMQLRKSHMGGGPESRGGIATHHHWAQSSSKCLFCRTGGLFLFSNLAKPLGTDRVRTLLWASFQHLTIVLDFGIPPYPISRIATGSPASQRPAFSAPAKNGTPSESSALALPITQPAVDSDLSVLRTEVSPF